MYQTLFLRVQFLHTHKMLIRSLSKTNVLRLTSQPVCETDPSSCIALRHSSPRTFWSSHCFPLQPARLGRGGGALGCPQKASGL